MSSCFLRLLSSAGGSKRYESPIVVERNAVSWALIRAYVAPRTLAPIVRHYMGVHLGRGPAPKGLQSTIIC